MIEVSEIYTAPQGEGPNLGRLSIFLRLRRCNLQCVWCDSKFTWSKEDPGYKEFTTYTPPLLVDALEEELTRAAIARPSGLVITGGEPLLWARFLPDVIARYSTVAYGELGYYPRVEIETAGTITPTAQLGSLAAFNVSPKLASSNNTFSEEFLWKKQAMIAHLAMSSTWKPVIDSHSIKSLLAWMSKLKRVSDEMGLNWEMVKQRIYLMPEGATRDALRFTQSQAIHQAEVLGVNVTTRMHVWAFSDERRR